LVKSSSDIAGCHLRRGLAFWLSLIYIKVTTMKGMQGRLGSGAANPIRYTGREMDETGLYYYRARYYSPEMGRFISEDPIRFAGGMNWYAYVENSPLNWVDPLGLDGLIPHIDIPGMPSNSRAGQINEVLLCHVNAHQDPMENAIGGALLLGTAAAPAILGGLASGVSSALTSTQIIIGENASVIYPAVSTVSQTYMYPQIDEAIRQDWSIAKERMENNRLPSQCVYDRTYKCHSR